MLKLSPNLMFNGPEATGSSTPPAETPPAAPAAPSSPAPETAAESTKTPPWGDGEFDADRAWTLLQNKDADLAAEKAKRATAVKDAETAAEARAKEEAYREFGKQLGVVKDDEAPTVEGLSQALQGKDESLSQSQAENQALRIENAILRHADRFGGDVDALTDSESFKKKLKELDPTDQQHAAQVEALVKSTVESHARYRKVQVAPKSSNGDPAPTGGTSTGEKSIDDIRKERQNRRGVTP